MLYHRINCNIFFYFNNEILKIKVSNKPSSLSLFSLCLKLFSLWSYNFWSGTISSISFRKNRLWLNRIRNLIFQPIYRISCRSFDPENFRKKIHFPPNIVLFFDHDPNFMLLTLFHFEHSLSSNINAFDFNNLLLYWGNYKSECPLNSKERKHWILDANMPWIFWNRRLAWAFHRLLFLNIQLHSYGFNDFYCMSTLLHPSYPIKTRVSDQKNFLIQLS